MAYRDRAILSLLAGLGLRAGEVATLELDDLDWHTGQLRLRVGKCRRERVLPLPQEVGAALAEYMVNGGASLKEIADVLGHRSLQTTGIYAKLDLDALASMALPWIGGAR